MRTLPVGQRRLPRFGPCYEHAGRNGYDSRLFTPTSGAASAPAEAALRSIPRSRRCNWLAAVALLLSFRLAGPALADPPETVTVEAQREQLRREVNQFVRASIVSPHTDDSLLRWDSPVCPLVAGLTREQGEFVLGRLSAIARAANVPLAGEHCEANLFVVVAHNPSGFLSLWWNHDRRLFGMTHGIGGVKSFIETDRPVRVWYNSIPVDADSGSEIATLLAQSVGIGQGAGPLSYPVNQTAATGSRLTYIDVRAIASVIVVIDAQKLANLNFGQLADYVSLRSLAEIKPDTDAGGAPSILKLFSEHNGSPLQGLTAWDRALLHALYSTKQKERRQLSEIQTATLNQLVAAPAH
jgi:hypothetical protein